VGGVAEVGKFAQFSRKRVCAARNPKSVRHSFSGVPIACGRVPRASIDAAHRRRAHSDLQFYFRKETCFPRFRSRCARAADVRRERSS